MSLFLIVGLIAAGAVVASKKAAGGTSPYESPPVSLIPGVSGVPETALETSLITGLVAGGVVGGVAVGIDAALTDYEERKARIAAEGQWAGQIMAYIDGIPLELLRQVSVQDVAHVIVKNLGFGGSWRIDFPNPVEGMRFVLTAPFQPTTNLRSINFTYQNSLRKAHGVGKAAWKKALTKVVFGRAFNAILALNLQPQAGEMRDIIGR